MQCGNGGDDRATGRLIFAEWIGEGGGWPIPIFREIDPLACYWLASLNRDGSRHTKNHVSH
jgi:hypothetical protein